MSQISVDVKVSRILKEFILCTNKSDNLVPEKYDDILKSIMPLLKTTPSGWKPIQDRSEYIRITLPYNREVDTRYRNYLDDIGQRCIELRLNKTFKSIFHNYVLAYVMAGRQQREGIEDFCDIYQLKCDNIDYEMLKKSWDRSHEKKLWKNSTTRCPVIF
jgi:hypothetical protein